MTACGAEAAAARSAMSTGSESGGAAGAPASPMRKRWRRSPPAVPAAPPAEQRPPSSCGHIPRARCTTPPLRRAATPEASLFLAFLQAAERTVFGGVDGGRAVALEGGEEGRGRGLVTEAGL